MRLEAPDDFILGFDIGMYLYNLYKTAIRDSSFVALNFMPFLISQLIVALKLHPWW